MSLGCRARRIAAWSIALAALRTSAAEAQVPGAPTTALRAPTTEPVAATLGLTEALRLAMRRDARFAVAAARTRAAEARRAEALVGYAPDVLVGVGYTAGFPGSGSNLQLRGMLGSPFFRNYVAGVDASWNLVDLLRTPHAVSAAEAAVDAAAAAHDTATREVALALVDLFERVLAAQERRALLGVEVGARRELLGALQARVAAGTLASDQALMAEAGVGDGEAERVLATAEERSARAALRALVGDDRALTASLVFDARGAEREPPEVRVAQALRRQASEVRTLWGMEWLPRVTVAGSVGYANPAPGSDPGYYALGAAVALPITGVVRERSRRAAEVASLEARASEADATLEQLAIHVAEIDAAIAGLDASLPAVEQGRQLADTALAGVAARVASGVVAPIDLEAALATQRRAQGRERLLRVHLEGLRARRVYLVASR
ncbi:MAG: TolC family protein [Myxococcaceae bacterium]|nr:MAG: TolC family protein [Myxococcaceae bacterium]